MFYAEISFYAELNFTICLLISQGSVSPGNSDEDIESGN